MQGYNFTERVRKALALAREEAAGLRHEYIGTEHILLGIIHEGEGVAATILVNLSVELDNLRYRVESYVKKGTRSTVGPDLPYTSRAKKVLELAMSEAREVNHTYVGTEHLLLGLLREKKGAAALILNDVGVTITNAREEMLRVLGDNTLTARPSTTETLDPIRGPFWTPDGQPTDALPERVRVVMVDAEQLAGEHGSSSVLPVHVAIALLQHGEGAANAVLDRLGFDRDSAIRALVDVARRDAQPGLPETTVAIGQETSDLQRHIEGEARWRSSPPGTLHILLGLLDTRAEISAIFEAQGLTANRVRAEARRISG
jgi:ATP-dependent Clp protease ATP-binding subunit ClpA